MAKLANKDILQRWEAYRKNVERATELPIETTAAQQLRKKKLLQDFEAFAHYYFPHYCSAPFAKFHIRFAKLAIESDRIYLVYAWAREHAKSVMAGLLVPIYLKMTGKIHNMMLVSHSFDNAAELLMPMMIELESNQRLIYDFGKQKSWRGWEVGKFITGDGCSFRAIGAGQSPRGSRNQEKRPDIIVIDDIDTDEERHNQARINRKWEWIEKALYPCMSISGAKRFIVVGNIISKESIVVKASKRADVFEKINILDKHGLPSWKERYTPEQVAYMLSKISSNAAQSEYFNNPITEGSVFKDMHWGAVPALRKFTHLVCYTDPSYKSSKNNDFKATVLVGHLNGTYYIIKCYVEQTTTDTMVQWHYDIHSYVGDTTVVYYYMEEVFLQDIFFHTFKEQGIKRGFQIPIVGDNRHKPDKFSRIEANLEPLNRRGLLVLNEAENNNPHMLRLAEQFGNIEPKLSAHDDAPDAVEGAVWMLNNKLKLMDGIQAFTIKRTKHKY